MIEGDWTNAGLSAVAIIPIFGEAATVGKIGSRTVVRVTREGVERVGREGIEAGLREARASQRAAGQAAEGAAHTPRQVDPKVDEAVERAFSENIGSPELLGGRSRPRIEGHRVPTRQRRRLDLEDIPRQAGETARQALARVRRIIGQKVSDVQVVRAAWDRARDEVLSTRTLDRSNYEELYNLTRNKFWQEVRRDGAARQHFVNAGFDFPSGSSTAPVLRNVDPSIPVTETRISLDHIQEKAIGDNWRRALDADNLRMEFAMPNTQREIIQARHPELRQ